MTAHPNRQTLLVTLAADKSARTTIEGVAGSSADIVYLADIKKEDRRVAISSATVLLSRNTGQELEPDEAALIAKAKLVQFVTAGVDYVPLGNLPPEVPVA
ncbi:MAG: hypothetical protein JSS20_15750, partial [Proteobacteria bacterium]|nr:hypothetical protein [Pseudomonadota bacterium]